MDPIPPKCTKVHHDNLSQSNKLTKTHTLWSPNVQNISHSEERLFVCGFRSVVRQHATEVRWTQKKEVRNGQSAWTIEHESQAGEKQQQVIPPTSGPVRKKISCCSHSYSPPHLALSHQNPVESPSPNHLWERPFSPGLI